ncbi:hypothetical protein BH20ACI4_BH20ACI4_32910 [soil metagenome]
MNKTFPFCLLIILLFINTSLGQDSLPDTKEIVNKAAEQQSVYVNTFKNLIAEENKTIESYDENGNLEKNREIVSTFIVYQFSTDANQAAEFRNVLSVDGKPVKNADKRAQKFFEKIVKAESSKKELDKLTDESLRYDRYLKLFGFTLNKAVYLSKNLISYFDFQIVRKENYNGREVFILGYKQLRESPDIIITTSKDIKLNARLSGSLWIDAETFQVWREERERTVQPEIFDKPVMTSQETYEYQKSDFGILTPKKITYTNYAVKVLQKTSVKDAKLTLEYGKFSKPETEIKSADVK